MKYKNKVALQTLLMLPLWFLLQNFNAVLIPKASDPTGDTTALCSGKSSYKIKKVVLDAGHGGKDPGCLGKYSREKHNALAIVLQLGQLISNEYPDVEVIYTRKKDEFIELNERAAIANRNNADLFISVHCNALTVPRAHGAETYVMGLHTAEHNLEVAKRENAAILLEDNYEKNYHGYDPNSPEAHIFGSVWQSAYLDQSILFASHVQKFAKDIGGRADRGVKQAGFIVLKETAMPAVLVETGFLTNAAEENFLASKEGQSDMAKSIFHAFKAYKTQVEGTAATNTSPPVASTNTKPAPAAQPKVVKTSVKAAPSQYRIHLLSWPSRLDPNTGLLALLSDVEEVKTDKEYEYYVGTFATPAEAEKMLAEIRNLGFRTAQIKSD
ncbi:MAG: N-acetylmuramoyl-L-alanine amidase [Saprospiraceae bacterium]